MVVQLTVSAIMDICEYVEAICTADATVILIALNQAKKPLTVRDVIKLVARETRGRLLLGDQSVRNAFGKLEGLHVVMSKTEPWGEKRTKTRYSLTQKGFNIIEALKAFCAEIRRQIEEQASKAS